MTSQINPNNINDQYPVAGQPNNTQGFRDNFAGTKTNFEYASDEITELQTKSILNAALTNGNALDSQNDMLGAPLIGAKVRNFSADAVNIATTSGPVTLDYSQGHYQRIATTGNVSVGFSNFPNSGSFGAVRLQAIIDSAGRTMQLSPFVSQGTTGIQGMANSVITFAQAGTYQFEFTTSDNGATIAIEDLNRPQNYFTNGLSSVSSTQGIGYGAGAGGTVTQTSSRTTGVTLNNVSGSITLVSAAGTSSYTTFTVTNSTVAATDVIIVNQQSGTDKYEAFVTNVSAGSFKITFSDVSGTTTEQPVFNFAVIKSVAA